MNHIKEPFSRKMYLWINGIVLFAVSVICLYPMIYVVFASFSSPNAMAAHSGALLWPLKPTLIAYENVLKNRSIWRGYFNNIFVVVTGVALNLVMTTLAAFFFSRKGVMHGKALMLIIMFTMFFSGGIIPTYLMLKNMGFIDNLLVLVIPGAINTTNMIIMRTAFYSVPDSLEESARMDGAGHLTVLVKIMIPLILPTFAVVGLYYAVGHWNSWFNASLYIKDRNLYPLQLVLREILILGETSTMDIDSTMADKAMLSETLKYAVIVVSTVPILCVYPFIQKYFVKGVMVGAVKE